VASGLIVEVNDPQYGLMKQPGPIAWLEESVEQMLTPKPRKEVDFSQAMAQLVDIIDSQVITRPVGNQIQPINNSAWLDGVRILDLTNVIAGPHSTAFLGRFGAEVIKLDPVTPLYDPLIGTLFTFQTNLGKKSVLVDITMSEGREIFERLVKSVDVVVINAPERQMEQLGLDNESLQAINPGVLFCRLDCLGGPKRGPKTDYIGYDDIIQANSGIMSRFGGIQTPEEHAHLGTLDVNCGFAGGLGMVVALYNKQKHGQTSRARTSLSAVTNLVQIKFAFDYEGRSPFNEASGREALGNNVYSHFYRTRNGFIFIDSNESELAKLETISELSGITNTENISEFLTERFIQDSSENWAEALQSADIAAAKPMGIEQLRDLYTRDADGTVGLERGSYAFSVYDNHPSGHRVTIIDQYAIRPTEAKILAIESTERFGHSTQTVLEGLGYNSAEVQSMIDRKIAATGWGREFLPS
jgi:crotonobetainyl-CoA:carnitine CoA-transferase CaiB-like acyl-CoA transferase